MSTNTRWKEVSWDDTVKNEPCRCIDGRFKRERFGVPGGSFAILFTVLNEIEQEFSASTMQVILENVSNLSPIYLHSDHENMGNILGDRDLRAEVSKDLDGFVERYLKNQGCGHLNIIYKGGSKRSKNLISNMTKAFWALWLEGRGRMIFESLDGPHQEVDVLLVRDSHPKLITFQGDRKQHFVYNLDVEANLATEICQLLLAKDILTEEVNIAAIQQALRNQANETVRILAKGLPINHINCLLNNTAS